MASHIIKKSMITAVVLPPRGHLEISGDVFACHSWWERGAATSSGWRLWILLNIRQYMESPPQQSNI